MKCNKTLEDAAKLSFYEDFRNMIKIFFVLHGCILKSSGTACKINDFTARQGGYYIIFERALS